MGRKREGCVKNSKEQRCLHPIEWRWKVAIVREGEFKKGTDT